MVPTFGVFIKACLLVGAVLWCREVFGRLGDDIGELVQSTDRFRRFAILFVWAMTGLIIFIMVRCLVGIFVPAVRALRTF